MCGDQSYWIAGSTDIEEGKHFLFLEYLPDTSGITN